MRAVILAGGEGTRLRPLTLTMPKPALQLVDRPFLRYMVDWLARHGIDDVVVASGFRAGVLRDALGDEGIAYVEETEPLGTAGPLRLVAEREPLGERFLVLNGDVLADLDLSALMRAHESAGAVATLALYAVKDPSAYGLVRHGPDGAVTEFLEKPGAGELDTNEISAGAYVLEREVLDLIPAAEMVSIEREIFPRLVGRGLYGQRLDGYWMDIGTPDRYLRASWDILEGRVRTDTRDRLGPSGLLVEDGAEVDPSATVETPVLVEANATVGAEARIGRAVVARGSQVGVRARVSGSVVLGQAEIGARAAVSDSIIAPHAVIGEGAYVGPEVVVGEGASVEPGARLGEGARLAPGELVR